MSGSRPLLVITPTLGRSPWLAATVSSVQRAVGLRAAHVLVAPGDKVEELARLFPHCKVVADSGGTGVYHAINEGFRHAPDESWKWFTWINDDDELLAGFSQHFDRAMSFDGCSLAAPWCYGQVKLLSGDGADLGCLATARNPADIAALAQSGINPLNQQGLLAPRAWVKRGGPIREDLRICADVDFWLRALTAGAKFRCSPEAVAIFRLHPGQISSDVESHKQEFASVVAQFARPRRSSITRLRARARFRISNAAVYLDRVRRVGWKGGFALLSGPIHKPT